MELKLKGLKEVEASLAALGKRDGARALRAAMLKVSKPVLKQAQSTLMARPGGSGALHRSLRMRFLIAPSGARANFYSVVGFAQEALGQRFIVRIFPSAKDRVAMALYQFHYRRNRGGLFHGHFIELGFRNRAGRKVGGQPFLRPALDRFAGRSASDLANEIRSAINRILAKRARQK